MTFSRYVMVKAMKPATHIARENGKQIVHVPDYDIDTDTATVAQFELIDDNKDRANAIKPGDVLQVENTEGGAEVVDFDPATGQVKRWSVPSEFDSGKHYVSPVTPQQGYINSLNSGSIPPGGRIDIRYPIVTDGAKLNEEHARANAKSANAPYIVERNKYLPDPSGHMEGSRWGDGNGKVYVLRSGAWQIDDGEYRQREA
jgi:hypothetical protein